MPQLGHIFPGISRSPGRPLRAVATAPTLSVPRRASQGSMCSRPPRTSSEGSWRSRDRAASTPGAAGWRARARAAAARTAGIGSAAAAWTWAAEPPSASRALTAAERTSGEGSLAAAPSRAGRAAAPSGTSRSTAARRFSQAPESARTAARVLTSAPVDSGWAPTCRARAKAAASFTSEDPLATASRMVAGFSSRCADLATHPQRQGAHLRRAVRSQRHDTGAQRRPDAMERRRHRRRLGRVALGGESPQSGAIRTPIQRLQGRQSVRSVPAQQFAEDPLDDGLLAEPGQAPIAASRRRHQHVQHRLQVEPGAVDGLGLVLERRAGHQSIDRRQRRGVAARAAGPAAQDPLEERGHHIGVAHRSERGGRGPGQDPRFRNPGGSAGPARRCVSGPVPARGRRRDGCGWAATAPARRGSAPAPSGRRASARARDTQIRPRPGASWCGWPARLRRRESPSCPAPRPPPCGSSHRRRSAGPRRWTGPGHHPAGPARRPPRAEPRRRRRPSCAASSRSLD